MDQTQFAKFFDHTLLALDTTPAQLDAFIAEARRLGCACAMVHPCDVPRCAELLKLSAVTVGTVLDFPLGMSAMPANAAAGLAALGDGADELDLVINTRRVRAAAAARRRGDETAAAALVAEYRAFVDAMRSAKPGAVLKLILECCRLDPEEKRLAAETGVAAGFDFIKTSTGFGSGGATAEDVRLMKSCCRGGCRVKAAGGIRNLQAAMEMIEAGAERIGCSATANIIEEFKTAQAKGETK